MEQLETVQKSWTHTSGYGDAEVATVWNESEQRYAHQIRAVVVKAKRYGATRDDRVWSDDISVDEIAKRGLDDLIQAILKRT